MDVGMNKPFKNIIQGQFHDWLVTNRKNRPSRQKVSWWVSGTWNAISASIVCNSFWGAGLIVAGIITETELIKENEMLSIVDSSLSFLVDPVRVIE
jgi:hypothetical protein